MCVTVETGEQVNIRSELDVTVETGGQVNIISELGVTVETGGQVNIRSECKQINYIYKHCCQQSHPSHF
jgi:hypothetical protein